jgi:hypothetical protein
MDTKWIYDSFWHTKFWLPHNYTWDDLGSQERFEAKYILFYPICIAITCAVLRTLFEKSGFKKFKLKDCSIESNSLIN